MPTSFLKSCLHSFAQLNLQKLRVLCANVNKIKVIDALSARQSRLSLSGRTELPSPDEQDRKRPCTRPAAGVCIALDQSNVSSVAVCGRQLGIKARRYFSF